MATDADRDRRKGSGKGSKHRDAEDRGSRLSKKVYEKELRRLQEELVKMEDWVAAAGARSSSCSRDATRPARAERSSGSPST